jgi:hypothetical protein
MITPCAPRSMNNAAIAAPSPCVPPVMTATFPSNCPIDDFSPGIGSTQIVDFQVARRSTRPCVGDHGKNGQYVSTGSSSIERDTAPKRS